MSSIKKYTTDKIIIKEGEISSRMYAVVEGHVILYLNYGQEDEILLGIISKDKIFGELALTSEAPSLYTAVAYDEVSILEIDRNNFSSFIKSNPDSAIGIIKNISGINAILRKNLDLLIDEIHDNSRDINRQKELRKNIARYSARGIESYLSNTQWLNK